ncbi:hypothetical protein T492DRAFT_893581 [Pavlovales sp. CCMP2436]|nr:hypothetical protein T492DRAFT_893581 [Pavlovales sp. CCMP2436]
MERTPAYSQRIALAGGHEDKKRGNAAEAGRESGCVVDSSFGRVQGNACRALCNITFGTDALHDAHTQSAVAAGALPQIVAAMRAHPATHHITFGTDALHVAHAQSAVDAGALLQIVAAMRAHSTNPALQTKACWALCNITAGVDVQRDARAQSAVAAGALPQIDASSALPISKERDPTKA